jgi:mitochondrial chaperone BCS1
MDLRVEYKLATTPQMRELFKRFYSPELMGRFGKRALAEVGTSLEKKGAEISAEALQLVQKAGETPLELRSTANEGIDDLAEQFASKIPADKFSIAQIQGYLLSKKRDPKAAVDHVDDWLKEREKEAEEKQVRLRKRAEERQKWERAEKRRLAREKREEAEAEAEAEREEAELAAAAGAKENTGENDSDAVKPEQGNEGCPSESGSTNSDPVVVENTS